MNKPRVYFAVMEDLSCVKIGYTTQLKSRISSIKTSCPRKLHFSSIAFSTKTEAQRAERSFHFKFKHLHIRLEWFKFNQEIAQEIKKVHFEYHRELELNRQIKKQRQILDVDRVVEKRVEISLIVSNKKEQKIEKVQKVIPFDKTMHYATNGFKTYCGIKPGIDTKLWTMMFQNVTCEKCKQERNRIMQECKKAPMAQKTNWANGVYK